jgi:serine/threonine-protein kinase
MSPEQLRGKPLDARTDVYSLSLMTFEMLTGALPFAGRTQQEMMISRLRNEPVRLRTVDPELPEAMEHVLLKAMSRDADSRYSTASEFADALAGAAQGRRTNSGVLGRLFKR